MTQHAKQAAPRLILASGSPRRKELLGNLGVPFSIEIPDVDETQRPGEKPDDLVLRLSVEKGRAVGRRNPEAVVIAADTIVVLDDGCSHAAESNPQILGKPPGPREAVTMLQTIQGREHTVYTGVAIYCGEFKRFGAANEVLENFVCCSKVELASLSTPEIESYVKTGEPLDKAGGYAVQGLGASFIAAIQGSYTNVVGLPLAEVREALKRLGIGLP